MKEDKFDRIVQEKLTNYDSEVPTHVWSNIEQGMKRKKDYPLVPIFISTLVLIGIVLLLVVYSSDEQRQNLSDIQSTHLQIESEGNNSDETIGESVSSSNTTSQSETLEKQAAADLSDGSDNMRQSTSTGSSITNSESEGENQTTINATKENFISTSSSKPKSSEGRNVDINDKTTEFSNTGSQEESVNEISKSQKADQSRPIAGHSTGEKTDAAGHTVITTNERNTDDNGSVESPDQLLNTVEQRELQSEQKIGSVEDEKLAEEISNRQSSAVAELSLPNNAQSLSHGHLVYDPCIVKGGKKKNRVHCYSFVSQNQLVFADFSIGPQYAHQLLTSRQIESDDLLNDRRNSESYLFAYNVTARMGLKLANGLTGTAGISYDRFHERFDYYDPNQNRTTITNVIVDTLVINGNTTYVWDTLSITTIGSRTVEHTNSLTFISVPLTLGYTWQMDKFNVAIQGGVSLNVLFSKGGRIIQPDNGVGSLNGDGHKSVYKSSAGLGLLGGVVIEYKLKNGMSFIAEPRFSYQLSNLTTNGYPLEQNYWTAGVNVGLRKVLGEKTSRKKKYGIN